MDDDPSFIVILGTIFLYIFLGFCLGLITWTWNQGKYGKGKLTGTGIQGFSLFFSRNKGRKTNALVCIKDYENHANEKLDDNAWNFFYDGASAMYTMQENALAYTRYQLMPKSLVDVAGFETKTTILGHEVEMPIGIAPVSNLSWAHNEGDIGAALAAEKNGTVFISSVYASASLEDIAAAAPNVIKWQQLYLFGLRDYTLDFIQRAEASGYTALVVTVDRPSLKTIYSSKRGEAVIPKRHKKYPNFKDYSEELEINLVNTSQSWAELKWLRDQTKLPIVLKGVVNENDVALAAEAGVNAILVSNHGGRILDGVPATIDVLEEIVSAAQGTRLEVYLDGGVTSGIDVFKALARGAKIVFIGRPVVWGLVHNGKKGVENILELLNTEFKHTAQLCGVTTIKDIEKSMIQYVGRA